MVYIMSSYRRTLYVGVTGNLVQRVKLHRAARDPQSFTARYNIRRLVYYEQHATMADAIAREKQIKKWRRSKKIALIEYMNPNWRDLTGEIAAL
jgi:putative endonuclease